MVNRSGTSRSGATNSSALVDEPAHQTMGLGRHLRGHGGAMIAVGGHTDVQLHARVENLAAIGGPRLSAFLRAPGFGLSADDDAHANVSVSGNAHDEARSSRVARELRSAPR